MTITWDVYLSTAAESDFSGIIRWTAKNFGAGQAAIYAEMIASAMATLADGPDVLGAKRRDDLGAGIGVLHIGRSGLRGRHILAFRVGPSKTIEIIRILHDSMDLPGHLDVSH
jgi:toxin ParE1/3/4